MLSSKLKPMYNKTSLLKELRDETQPKVSRTIVPDEWTGKNFTQWSQKVLGRTNYNDSGIHDTPAFEKEIKTETV